MCVYIIQATLVLSVVCVCVCVWCICISKSEWSVELLSGSGWYAYTLCVNQKEVVIAIVFLLSRID